MLSPEFIAEMRQVLEEQKARFQTELAGLKPHTEVGSESDENASELEIDEVSQDLIARMNADIEKIDAALAKIEAGTYGVGADGNEISEDRLRAIPWADKAI